jgi:hypothetical protein
MRLQQFHWQLGRRRALLRSSHARRGPRRACGAGELVPLTVICARNDSVEIQPVRTDAATRLPQYSLDHCGVTPLCRGSWRNEQIGRIAEAL